MAKDFEDLDDDTLDQIVGGRADAFGVQFNLTASIPGTPIGGSLSLAITGQGIYGSAGGFVGGGFSASVDGIAINTKNGGTVSDVMTGMSYGGDLHVGAGMSYYANDSGSVAGFGLGLGAAGGATYGVSLQGAIAPTEESVHSQQDAAAIQYGLNAGYGDPNLGSADSQAAYANDVRGAFPGATTVSDHAIQSAADSEAINQGLAAGRIGDDDLNNLGPAGAAAYVRETDDVAQDPHALDDHGFHDASPDGTTPSDTGDTSDHGFHDASPDGTPGGDSGDVSDHGFHDASPDGHDNGQPTDPTAAPTDHSADPPAAAAPTDTGDTSDHGFHNASPDPNGGTADSNQNTQYAGPDPGDAGAYGGYGGGGGDFGGGGDGGGDDG